MGMVVLLFSVHLLLFCGFNYHHYYPYEEI